MSLVQDNIESVLARIRRAAQRVERDPQGIKLIAVSKRKSIDNIRAAIDAGQTVFGENYLQEAALKIEALEGQATFHFIGHLQSNKAKQAAELFDVIETVDRFKLAKKLSSHLEGLNKTVDILVQVNVGGEAQKAGVSPGEAKTLLKKINSLPCLNVTGLMTMPPYFSDAEKVRPYFRQLHQLAQELSRDGLFADKQNFELSMGMSGDFEVAIEEGATLVRVGTAIFGARM